MINPLLWLKFWIQRQLKDNFKSERFFVLMTGLLEPQKFEERYFIDENVEVERGLQHYQNIFN